MAIKIKRPAFYKPSAVKEFTDRVEPRKAFWNRYAKMVSEGSTVITFYGTGGVGKTALLKKLEEEIKKRDELTRNECKYVKYDFNVSTDSREVLKTFKFQLSAYGCEFPLFDAGNYYYSLKVGQDVTPLKAKSMMNKIPWLGKLKENFSKVDDILSDKSPILDTETANLLLFDMADDVLQALPFTRVITTCFSVVDSLLVNYMERNQILDEDHQTLRYQINARFREKNPIQLYELLPSLFAMDVADWMAATGNKLVVILDNYEALTGATGLVSDKLFQRDSWLCGDEGLIFMIPDTLWTIAGRNKLHWGGELADELEQHLITALSPEDSDCFLRRAGIADENLRGELVKLTEGYPIFLDLCVDVYTEYRRQHNSEPTIDEFGQKRQDVVARIFRYLDADRDDAAKDMLEYLCVLSVWTDEIAIDIGGKALQNFSRNTYKRVKNFSFVREEQIESDDFKLTFYTFDRTIQSILVAACDEKLIADVKAAVNDYFKNFFADKKTFDAEEIFYLKLWANFIVRFADAAETLQNEYEDKWGRYVHRLTDSAEFDAAEEILNLFTGKLESLGETDGLPRARFELELGNIRRAQGNYSEAYDLANFAYEKCVRLLSEEHIYTLEAVNNLATTLNDLGRYDEALKLQEQALSLSKKIFGDEDIDTVNAMSNLAATLGCLERYDEALKLQEQVLTLRRKILGTEHPDTLSDMSNLAITLGCLERYDEALKLQEQVLTLSRKILGDEHPDTLKAMNNLAGTLSCLDRDDEALTLREQFLMLSKKFYGDESPETLEAMDNLAVILSYLNRDDEALTLREQVLTLSKKIFGDKSPETLEAVNNLASAFGYLDRNDEALTLREQVLTLSKKILGDESPETLEVAKKLAETLIYLDREDEAVTLLRDMLNRCEKTLGEAHPLTITAMKNLAEILNDIFECEEALQLIERAAELAQEVFGDEHPETQSILELREEILLG